MDVNDLSKEQLCSLVSSLRQRITGLESSEKGRRQAQAALRENVEIYRSLLEICPVAIIITDLKAAVIMANQEALKMLGYGSLDEIIGKNLFSILAPEYRKKAKESMQDILLSKQIRHTDGVLLKKDNTLISVEVSFTTIRDMGGNPEGVICAMKDVTERKRMEAQLRESELLYRSLSEGAISGVYIIQDGKFRYINPALAQMFGYGVDEVIDKIGPAMLTYPPDRPLVLKQIKLRIKGELEVARYSFRGLRKDGGIIYCECLGSRIMFDEKPAIIGTLLDISARKEEEEALLYKAELKTIIMFLSNKFINMNSQHIDDALNDALRVIGGFAGVDRSYIFMFSSSGKTMDNTHEWCAMGIEPQIERLKKIFLQSFPWFVKRIKKAQVVYVPSVERLPLSAAAEKKEWQRESIQSLINVPMVFQNEVIGFVGFDSVRQEKEWTDDMRVLLRIIGDMFAGIIKRREMGRDIKSLNKELLKANMRLKQLALRDSLTGLYNHRYFEEAIEAEFMRAKRQALPLAVIMLDVDYFKSINDVYGHQFGDVVLKQLAGQLLGMVRKYDTVIRYGGEEFVIITPGANKEISFILAQRLMDVIKLYHFGDKEHSVKLKLSVAVSSFPEDKINKGEDFIKIADYILNKVKETGGD
ncbi:MAG: diguanylate cyclase, partial [Candidatus Omnitrophica bacterium]|nr:diguanylate cyclase [Candidatus Omnitrophota bacterium]